MNVHEYLRKQFNINPDQRSQPVEIPNTNRHTLASMFFDLGYSVGAEIGVEEGVYSEVLLRSNPRLHLYSIDAWEVYGNYRDHMKQSEMDDIYKRAVDRLKPYSCTVLKGYSVDMAKQFDDNSLDFVYLDANHEFVHVVNDIAAWEPKVKVGGIISGHDYIKRKRNDFMMHVPQALQGYTDSYKIRPLYVLGRKEANSNSNPEKELRESTRSWFYVKQSREISIDMQ